MSWKTPILDKTFDAGAAINPYRFVKFGVDDHHVIQAAAATDSILGVTGQVGAAAAEDRLDVTLIGIAEIELAANLARGVQVTADASGQAVAAAAGNALGGKLLASGVSGDIVPILIQLGTV